jgi:hypothetical protein
MYKYLSSNEELTHTEFSCEDDESLRETIHLLKRSKNAKRLQNSIKEINTGKGEMHELYL